MARPLLTRPDVLGSPIYGLSEHHLSGTLSARPAAGTVGRMYFATDVVGGRVYRDNGTTWDAISPSVGWKISSVGTFTGNGQGAATDVTLATLGTLPANLLAVGDTIQYSFGFDSDILNSATARTMSFKVKFGSTLIIQTNLTVTVSAATTNGGAILTGQIVCYTTGASGTVRAQNMMLGTFGGAKTVQGSTPVSGGVTIDTTASQAITVTVQESVNSVADVVRCESGFVVLL